MRERESTRRLDRPPTAGDRVGEVAPPGAGWAALVRPAGRGAGSLTAADVLRLQRAVGNRASTLAIQRLAVEHHALNDDPEPFYEKNCFMAVLTWLLRAYRDVDTGRQAADIIMKHGYPGPLVQKILGMATMLQRPAGDDQLRVRPGQIIIFASGGAPTHAAVATGRLQITGYNQTNWFGQAPNKHSHSSLEGVRWVTKDEIEHFPARRRENVYEADPAAAATVFPKGSAL